jgi:hypothetical protein
MTEASATNTAQITGTACVTRATLKRSVNLEVNDNLERFYFASAAHLDAEKLRRVSDPGPQNPITIIAATIHNSVE